MALKPPAAFGSPGRFREVPGQGKTGGEEGEEMEQTARTSPADPPLCFGVRVRLVQVCLSSAKRQFLICKIFN